MKSHIVNVYAILLVLLCNCCNAQPNKNVADTSNKGIESNPWPPGDRRYIALKDSAKLVHIENQFYRNKAGTLFEKMGAPKNPIDPDADGMVFFFRITNQQIDPLTFDVIDGSWFARDKNFVYNYRANDSGMFCITMPEADVKYFKLLPGNTGMYGADRKHVFEEAEIIQHLNPLNMRVITNKEGYLLKIISGPYIFDTSSGVHEAVLIKHTKRH